MRKRPWLSALDAAPTIVLVVAKLGWGGNCARHLGQTQRDDCRCAGNCAQDSAGLIKPRLHGQTSLHTGQQTRSLFSYLAGP